MYLVEVDYALVKLEIKNGITQALRPLLDMLWDIQFLIPTQPNEKYDAENPGPGLMAFLNL